MNKQKAAELGVAEIAQKVTPFIFIKAFPD
jgi:hypothetical protein